MMEHEQTHRETMWAEMKPDCYGGDGCEEITPNWYSYAEGDKQGGDDGDTLSLSAKTFPPGTRIVVSEPICSNCGEVPSRSREPITFIAPDEGSEVTEYIWTCGCDFDWRAEAMLQYT